MLNRMARPFLTARWANLAIVTYAVDPALLEPFLPRDSGIVLDTRDDLASRGGPDGPAALISLVAFEFLDTRVFGIRWPTLVDFPEINLRFYVRRGQDRGVMFLREIVPRAAISLVARLFYSEPYVTAPIRAEVRQTPDTISAEYRLDWPSRDSPRGKFGHVLRVTAGLPDQMAASDSLEHWIKEHRWGFTARPRGGAWVYEVSHPVWAHYPNASAHLRWNFGEVYGPRWAFLADAAPVSTLLAKGSDIAVYPRGLEDRLPFPE